MWGKIVVGDSRKMKKVGDQSIDLVVTSPPYWHIKDYGTPGQIGFGQTLHEYLVDLYRVWTECHRILRPGARLCINIGDQFARSAIYGRYKVIPLHAEFIAQCEKIGFDFMGSIIWQKKTTMNTTGGATVMGSFPHPPNGIIEIDYEFIHIFKKPGKNKKVAEEVKRASRLSTDEWKEFFLGHWYFGGARQVGHEAMFPDELPRRLMRMFTFVGDTVLDPFLGSGTSLKVALQLERNAIGYEINEAFLEVIMEKVGMQQDLLRLNEGVEIERQESVEGLHPEIDYVPGIQDAQPKMDPKDFDSEADALHRVAEIVSESTIRLNTGTEVRFLGVRVQKKEEALSYLRGYVLGKNVILKFDGGKAPGEDTISAYVYLKNRIFVNRYLIKAGLASADPSVDHRLRAEFQELSRKKSPPK